MITNFTQNDLIRYVYGETTSEESNKIEQQMLLDTEFELQFKEICGIVGKLKEVNFTPSEGTLDNIRNYSKSLNLLSKD